MEPPPTGGGEVDLFSARGAVVAQIESEPPRRVLFRWRRTSGQGEERDSLLILSPAGTALLRADRSPGRFVLRFANGNELEGDAARARLRQETGWRMPLDEAAWWLRCLSHPDRSTVERTNQMGEKRIEQSGWEILCTEYDEEGRPVRLRLKNGQATLQIRIEDWTG